MGPRLRGLVPSRDARDVARIDRAATPLPLKFLLNRDDVEEVLDNQELAGTVVELPGGALAGFCVWGHQAGQNFAVLFRLAVLPKYRLRGLGSLLLDDVKARLRGPIPARKLLVYVPESHLPGQLWLRDRGFVCTAIHPEYFGPRPAYVFTYKAPRPHDDE